MYAADAPISYVTIPAPERVCGRAIIFASFARAYSLRRIKLAKKESMWLPAKARIPIALWRNARATILKGKKLRSGINGEVMFFGAMPARTTKETAL